MFLRYKTSHQLKKYNTKNRRARLYQNKSILLFCFLRERGFQKRQWRQKIKGRAKGEAGKEG